MNDEVRYVDRRFVQIKTRMNQIQGKADHWFIRKLSRNYSPCHLSFKGIDKGWD